MNMCAKFHRATFSTLGDIPGTLNLEFGRETGRGSGRKFIRDVLYDFGDFVTKLAGISVYGW
jgi:hypothetical protein